MSTTTNPAAAGRDNEPTPAPCPSWCDQPAEHEFDCASHDETQLYRYHSLDFGHWTPFGSPEWARSDYGCPEVWVDLVAAERVNADSSGGDGLLLAAPWIRLYAENADLSAEQARGIAAGLLLAAAQLEAIEAGR